MAHIQRKTLTNGKTAYVVRYIDPTGKERSKSFGLQRDARAFWEQTETSKRRGEWIAPEKQTVTLRELLERNANQAETEGTKLIKLSAAKNLGTLGDTPIGRIEPAHIRQWLIELRDGRPWADGKTLESSSIGIYLRSVKTTLRQAVSDGLLVKSPAASIPPPKVPDDAVTLEKLIRTEDLELIMKAASETVRIMILTQASTGLRPGELCGLRRRNVDLSDALIHVREQSGRKGNPWAWHPLKTPASRRTVPVPSRALQALRDHLSAHSDLDGDAPLFITRQGGQFTSNTYGEAFGNARTAAKVTAKHTPHDCRHYFASLLISQGVNVQAVADRLGHATASETLRTYSHLWPEDGDQTRLAVDEVLGTAGDPV